MATTGSAQVSTSQEVTESAQSSQESAEPPFVAIAPCRILDSAAGTDAGQRVRAVDLISTRCGRIIPPYATKYSVRITTIPRVLADQVTPGTVPAEVTALKIPAQSGRPLSFDVPDGVHIAVDVDGYYVAPGTPVSPVAATAVTGSATASATATSPFRQAPVAHNDGNAGHLYLDASQLSHTGVLMTAATGSPWIAAKTGTNTAGSGFAVINASNTELMRVRGDGAVQLAAGAFFDGRIDYFGSPGSYYGYVSVPGNVINDVTLVNPYDASGGNANRVVFFRARTDDEFGSPPTTKFEAFTLGYYGQENVNFDSKIRYHWPGVGQYHFRAMGVEYQNSAFVEKPTFWVKADTNSDAYTQTRADMYVSGRVGIGTATPSTYLNVVGSNPSATGHTAQFSSAVGAGSTPSNQVNISSAPDTWGLLFGFNGSGISPSSYHRQNGAHIVNVQNGPLSFGTNNSNRMTISGGGSVGIGTPSPIHGLDLVGNMAIGPGYASAGTVPANGLVIEGSLGVGTASPAAKVHVIGNLLVSGSITGGTVIGALYQDLAEWVPATSDMTPGTVVVLNPGKRNEVMPSASPYDTSVAGVVSAQPGLILGEAAATKEMIATTGRVLVRVDATQRPIAIGDLLVTSGKPGMAMKSVPVELQGVAFHRPGTVVGKALEPLESGEGEILVLLSLQ